MSVMTNSSIALAITEDSKSRGLAEQIKELESILQVYKEQNRFLSECNVKLERALDTLTQSDGSLKERLGLAPSLFDSSRDAVLLHDAKGVVVDANSNSVDMFGCPKEKMIGRSVVSLFTIDQRKAVAKNMQNVVTKGTARFEAKLRRADNSTIYLDIDAEIIDKKKNIFRLMARDISSFIKTREQLMRNRVLSSLGEMMAGIAHEVNNPLGIILLYSELLLNSDDTKQSQRDLRIIHGEAKRAVKILSALLAYTRKTNLQTRRVDLNRILRATFRMRSYAHKVANIEDKLTLPEGPLYVAGSVPQLTQVVTNIVLNAEEVLKRKDGGTIAVTAKVVRGRVKLTIADDGTGIDPVCMDKVFYPFFTTKEPGKGTGLGLSTCYGIITALNGLMSVENNEQGGATFVIEIPLWRSR
jgi:two-component system NtrC family sensor kinase